MKKTVLAATILCLCLLFAGCASGSGKPGASIKDKNDRQNTEERPDKDDNDDNERENDKDDDKRVSLKKSSDSTVSDWSTPTIASSGDLFDDDDENDDKDKHFIDREDEDDDRDYDGWGDDYPQSATEPVYVEPGSGSDEYLLPDSDSRYLTEDDLEDLDPDLLRIARNEIYARHGRKFSDPELQDYFNVKSWYNGTIDPKKFDEKTLNEYEQYNRDFIVKYEKKLKKK